MKISKAARKQYKLMRQLEDGTIGSVKTIRFYPRSLARSVAKAKMRAAGVNHVNTRFGVYEEWKRWVYAPIPAKAGMQGTYPRKAGKR